MGGGVNVTGWHAYEHRQAGSKVAEHVDSFARNDTTCAATQTMSTPGGPAPAPGVSDTGTFCFSARLTPETSPRTVLR